MYLLHCRETRFDKRMPPGDDDGIVLEQDLAFAFKGHFNDAMIAVLDYAEMCEQRDPANAYTFVLITVSEIPDDADEDTLDSLGVEILSGS